MNAPPSLELWEHLMRADEANLAYFAERTSMPGVTIFKSERPDAPEFDVAIIYRPPGVDSGATMRDILDTIRAGGRNLGIRLGPVAELTGWPLRLRRSGFAASAAGIVYFELPKELKLAGNPAIAVRQAMSRKDADAFSAIQAAGFELSASHAEWERDLARRHVAAGSHRFYLALRHGRPVGAVRCIHLPEGTTAFAALATVPEARRRGVATRLLARIVEDACHAGSTTITGTTVPGTGAAAMYARLGVTSRFCAPTFQRPISSNAAQESRVSAP
jgi:GNAT superfamily N-acetyltransferase